MRPKPQIIHEWTEPAKLRIHEAKQLLRQAKVAIPRILVITLVIEAVLYFLLTTLIPEEIQKELEFSWFRLFRNAFLGCVALTSMLYLIMIVTTRYLTRAYKLKENGVFFISGGGGWSLRWNRIGGYAISQHQDLPEITLVLLYTSQGQKAVYLPEGDRWQLIVATIASRVPLVDVPDRARDRPHLSTRQWLYICLLVLPYLGLVPLFPTFIRYGPWFGVALVAVPMLLGPGFVGFRLLFGKGWSLNLRFKRYAIAINLVTFVLVFLSVFALGLYLLVRQLPPSAQ